MSEAACDRDELAASLRAGYRAMLLEADEWRPLAGYVLSLMDLVRRQERAAMRAMLEERKRSVHEVLRCSFGLDDVQEAYERIKFWDDCLAWLDRREEP